MKLFRIVSLIVIGLMITACATTSGPQMRSKEEVVIHQEHNVQISKKIYVDAAFNEDEIIAIKQAKDILEHGTNGIVKLDLVFGFDMNVKNPDTDPYKYINKIILKKMSSKSRLIRMLDEQINDELEEEYGRPMDAQVLGYDLKQKGFEFIFIVSDRLLTQDGFVYTKKYANVVAHEELHSYGLKHADSGPSLMNTVYDQQIAILTDNRQEPLTCFTKHDAQQFCEIYICDWTKLNYC